jgi:lipoprotein-anchoring transpeptidase ErfK/SrfK
MANRTFRQIAMLLIVLIVGGVILLKTYNRPEPQAAVEEPTVAVEDILPNKAAARPDAPKPRITPTPDPSPQVIAVNPQSQTPAPAQTSRPEPAGLQSSAPASSNAALAPIAGAPAAGGTTPPASGNVPLEGIAAAASNGDTVAADVKAAIERSVALRDQGKIAAARDLLNSVLDEPMSPQVRAAVKAQLSKLAETWLAGKEVMADDTLCSYYEVQSGDKLALIAKKYKVPFELLMDINGIQKPEQLQAGQRLKVVEGPFNVVVYKGSFTLDLYLQRTYIKTYRVGLGKVEHETPSGRWRVQTGGKMIKPTWTDPDTGKRYVGSSPDYPLGSRWIALEGIEGAAKGRTGFAIHGTKDPETIGTRSSRGCIRLYNGDVIEIYDRMFEGVSEVLVKD